MSMKLQRRKSRMFWSSTIDHYWLLILVAVSPRSLEAQVLVPDTRNLTVNLNIHVRGFRIKLLTCIFYFVCFLYLFVLVFYEGMFPDSCMSDDLSSYLSVSVGRFLVFLAGVHVYPIIICGQCDFPCFFVPIIVLIVWNWFGIFFLGKVQIEV